METELHGMTLFVCVDLSNSVYSNVGKSQTLFPRDYICNVSDGNAHCMVNAKARLEIDRLPGAGISVEFGVDRAGAYQREEQTIREIAADRQAREEERRSREINTGKEIVRASKKTTNVHSKGGTGIVYKCKKTTKDIVLFVRDQCKKNVDIAMEEVPSENQLAVVVVVHVIKLVLAWHMVTVAKIIDPRILPNVLSQKIQNHDLHSSL